jgi:hypothetical protein
MPKFPIRKFACLLILGPCAGLVQGCGPEKVKLTAAPPVAIPPAQKPEDLPKAHRPAKGSSAGMNYNPLTGKPD